LDIFLRKFESLKNEQIGKKKSQFDIFVSKIRNIQIN